MPGGGGGRPGVPAARQAGPGYGSNAARRVADPAYYRVRNARRRAWHHPVRLGPVPGVYADALAGQALSNQSPDRGTLWVGRLPLTPAIPPDPEGTPVGAPIGQTLTVSLPHRQQQRIAVRAVDRNAQRRGPRDRAIQPEL